MMFQLRHTTCALMVLFAFSFVTLSACSSFNNQNEDSASLDGNEMDFNEVPKTTPAIATDDGGASMGNDTAITDLRYVSRKGGGTVVVESSSPLTFRTRENKEQNQFVVDIANSRLPDRLKRPYITKDFGQSVSSINAYQDAGSSTAHVVIQFRTPTRATVTQSGNRLLVFANGDAIPLADGKARPLNDADEIESLARTASLEGGPGDARILPQNSIDAENMRFFGRPISIEVRDMAVRDVIQLIAEQSGANIVLAGGTDGNISLKLKQIPWDQALMIVMKSQNLGYVRQGTVLRIASLDKLKQENESQKQILEAQLAAEPLKVKIVPVSYASVTDLTSRITPFLTKNRGAVVADPRTSSLVITDTPAIIERIVSLIKALDTPPLQVLIEGKVVEASENFARNYGINWGASGAETALGGKTLSGNNLRITPASIPGMLTYNVRLGTFDIFGDLDAAIGLAETQDMAKVVSSPRIVTMNNEAANITQGRNIFIPVQTVVGTATTTTQQAVTVNLTLDVTPQVTNEGDVLMALNITRQFVSSAGGGSSTTPPIESRSAKTKIMVHNGQTAVVGGVYQSDMTESETGVPWLKNVPVLGWLFKSKSYNNTKNELLVFLTPRIINSDTSAPKEGTL